MCVPSGSHGSEPRQRLGVGLVDQLCAALAKNTTLEVLDLAGCLPPLPLASGEELEEPDGRGGCSCPSPALLVLDERLTRSPREYYASIGLLCTQLAAHPRLRSVRLESEWLSVATLRSAPTVDLRRHSALGRASTTLLVRLLAENVALREVDVRLAHRRRHSCVKNDIVKRIAHEVGAVPRFE